MMREHWYCGEEHGNTGYYNNRSRPHHVFPPVSKRIERCSRLSRFPSLAKEGRGVVRSISEQISADIDRTTPDPSFAALPNKSERSPRYAISIRRSPIWNILLHYP